MNEHFNTLNQLKNSYYFLENEKYDLYAEFLDKNRHWQQKINNAHFDYFFMVMFLRDLWFYFYLDEDQCMVNETMRVNFQLRAIIFKIITNNKYSQNYKVQTVGNQELAFSAAFHTVEVLKQWINVEMENNPVIMDDVNKLLQFVTVDLLARYDENAIDFIKDVKGINVAQAHVYKKIISRLDEIQLTLSKIMKEVTNNEQLELLPLK